MTSLARQLPICVIYFAGISGLLIYNIGSGILRAVGDTTRPLYFLILTSVLNIILDLLFVIVFHLGIAGVAYATIIAQFISAGLILLLLTVDKGCLPLCLAGYADQPENSARYSQSACRLAIQSVITAFSNTFVQSYINYFGSGVMAGWSCYNKLDMFIMLPMNSMAMAATTFVGQNNGAKKIDRVNKGTKVSVYMSLVLTLATSAVIWIVAPQAIELFTDDPAVVTSGAMFVRMNRLLPAVQLRQPCAGGLPARTRRFHRADGHHADRFRGGAADISVFHHPVCHEYGTGCRFRVSGRLDGDVHHGSTVFLKTLEAQRGGCGLRACSRAKCDLFFVRQIRFQKVLRTVSAASGQ